MAIGQRNESNIIPALKVNAREGKVTCKDRVFHEGAWSNKDRDITDMFAAIMDLENMQVGWVLIQTGKSPDLAMASIGKPRPERPSDQHKLGIQLRMLLAEECGGDLRELLNTSVAVWDAVDELHNQYLAEAPKHPGQLPKVRIARWVKRQTGQGPSMVPVFQIVGWVERPWEIPVPGSKEKSASEPDDMGDDDTDWDNWERDPTGQSKESAADPPPF
jgi:hypothetical protein